MSKQKELEKDSFGNRLKAYTKDEKNSLAYQDVLDCKESSLPNDKDYMNSYRFFVNCDSSRFNECYEY